MLSAYEQERAKNIEANNAVLQHLGLEKMPPPPKAAKRRRSSDGTPTEPVRKSSRISMEGSTAVKDTAVKLADISPWEDAVFRECEQAVASSSSDPPAAVWDASKHHQHLTRSSSGRSIATTGVAGYGAGLVQRRVHCLGWTVRAVRFGVGGFAVGVVKRSMPSPFKSLGRSEHAIAVFHSSGRLEQGAGKNPRDFGSGYDEGDLVEVVLRPMAAGTKPGAAKAAAGRQHDVIFLLNGEQIGVAASGVVPDSVVLAVQPYMGGVALLES